MPILSPKLKAVWLSAKILIKIRTLSTDSAILIWIYRHTRGFRLSVYLLWQNGTTLYVCTGPWSLSLKSFSCNILFMNGKIISYQHKWMITNDILEFIQMNLASRMYVQTSSICPQIWASRTRNSPKIVIKQGLHMHVARFICIDSRISFIYPRTEILLVNSN